jgi:hypothetical protein
MLNGSAVNLTLGTGEVLTTTSYWRNTTTSTDPQYWDYYPILGSVIAGKGTPISGFTKDFNNQKVSTTAPSIGILEFIG